MDPHCGENSSLNHTSMSESFQCRTCQQEENEDLSRRISELKSESVRLSTFCTWEYGHVQNARELARWGMFYTGQGDAVQCAFCHGVLKRWEKTDLPYNEHAKYFPRCRFIRGFDVGNIPISSEPGVSYNRGYVSPSVGNNGVMTIFNSPITHHYGPSPPTLFDINNTLQSNNGYNPNGDFNYFYKNEKNRLASFSRWPPNKIQTPEMLSQAGFYHKPSPDRVDRVKCGYCTGKLYNWQAEDDPWIEHARCFPHCRYVQLCLGPEVVSDLLQESSDNRFREDEHVTTNTPTGTSGFTTTTQNPSTGQTSPGTHNPSSATQGRQTTPSETQTASSEQQKSSEDSVPVRMTSEPVQAVLQMGFSESMVKQTVEKCLRERPGNFPPAEELASMLMELEEEPQAVAPRPAPVMSPLQRLIAAQAQAQAQGQGTDLSTKSMTSSASRRTGNDVRPSPEQRLMASRQTGSDVKQQTDINHNEPNAQISENGGKKGEELTTASQAINKDKLRSENSKLKDQYLCKICMENYVRVTFMPCGHLVCCANCSLVVSECPICRSQITGYVKTYF